MFGLLKVCHRQIKTILLGMFCNTNSLIVPIGWDQRGSTALRSSEYPNSLVVAKTRGSNKPLSNNGK